MPLTSQIYNNNVAPPPGTGSAGSPASSSLSVASVRAALSSFIPQAVIDALGGPNAIQVTQVSINGNRTIVIQAPNLQAGQIEYSNTEIKLSERTDNNGQRILVVESSFELAMPDALIEGVANFAQANGYTLIEGKVSIIAGQPEMRATPEQILSALQGKVQPQPAPQQSSTYNPIVAQPSITSAEVVPLTPAVNLYNQLIAVGPDGQPAWQALFPPEVVAALGTEKVEIEIMGAAFVRVVSQEGSQYRFAYELKLTGDGQGLEIFSIYAQDTSLPGSQGFGAMEALINGARQLGFEHIAINTSNNYHNVYQYMQRYSFNLLPGAATSMFVALETYLSTIPELQLPSQLPTAENRTEWEAVMQRREAFIAEHGLWAGSFNVPLVLGLTGDVLPQASSEMPVSLSNIQNVQQNIKAVIQNGQLVLTGDASQDVINIGRFISENPQMSYFDPTQIIVPSSTATTSLTVEGLAQAFSGADPLGQLTSLNNSEAAISGEIAPGIERPADMNGNPGALVKISGDKTVVFVGDLHGNVDNLNAILEQYSDGIRSGEVVLVMLGDAIHPETGDLTDVNSSIQLMDAIVSLRAMYPNSVLFLQGNHDTVSESAPFVKPGADGDQIDQGQLLREALIAERGIEYVEALETFFEGCPLSLIVEGANPAVAGHALILGKESLPPGMTLEEALINARLNGLALGLTMNQMGLDYDSSDVTWMQQQLGLPENTMFITGHLPDLSQGSVAYLQGNGQPAYIHNGTDGRLVTLMSTGNNVSVIEVTHGASAEVAVVDVQGSSTLGEGTRSADLAAGQVQSAAPDFVFADPVFVDDAVSQPIDIRDIHSPQELLQHLMAGRTIVLYRGESEAGLETGYTFDTVPEEVRAGRMERPSDAALEAYRQVNNPNLPSRVSGVFLATSPDDAQFYSERVYRLEISLSPEVIAGIQSGQITALPVGWYDYNSYASAANHADADGNIPEEMMARYFRGPGNGGTSEIVVDPTLVTVRVAGEYTAPVLNILPPMVNEANLEIGTAMTESIVDDWNLAESIGLGPKTVIIRDGSYVISLQDGQEVDHAALAEIAQNGGSVANYAGLPPMPLFSMPELPAEMKQSLDAIRALNPSIANLIETQLSTLTPDELAQIDLAKLEEYPGLLERGFVRGRLNINYYEGRESQTREMLLSMGMSEANVNTVLAEMRWMHMSSAFGSEIVGLLKGKIDNIMDFNYKELHQGVRSNSNDYLTAQLGFNSTEAAQITDIVRARSAAYSAGMLSQIESEIASGQLEASQISHYQAVLDNMIAAGQNVEQAQTLKAQLEAMTNGTEVAAAEAAAVETPTTAPATPVSIVEIIKKEFDLSDAEVEQLIELISRPGLTEEQFFSELVEMGLSLDVSQLKTTLNQALMEELTVRAAADPEFAAKMQEQFQIHGGRIGIGSILSEIGQEFGQEYAQGGLLALLKTNSPVVQFLLEPVVEGEFWTSMARGKFGVLKDFFGKMMPATSAGILGNSAYNAILNVLGVSQDSAARGLLPQVTVGVLSTMSYAALVGAGTSSGAFVRTLSRLLSNPITQRIFVAVALSGPIASQVSSWMGYEDEFAVGATIARQDHPTAYGVLSSFFGSEWATMILNDSNDIANYELQLAEQAGHAEAAGHNLIDALSALALIYIIKNPPVSNPELYQDYAVTVVTPNPDFSDPEYYQRLIGFLSQAMNLQSGLSFDPSLFAENEPLAEGDPIQPAAIPDFLGQNIPQLNHAELAYAMLVGIAQGQDLSVQMPVFQALGMMDSDGQPIESNPYVQQGRQLFDERREEVGSVGLVSQIEGVLHNSGREALNIVQNVNQQVDRARDVGLVPGLDVNLPDVLFGDGRGVVDEAALMHYILELNQETINEITALQQKIQDTLGLVLRALKGEAVELDFSDPIVQNVLNYLINHLPAQS